MLGSWLKNGFTVLLYGSLLVVWGCVQCGESEGAEAEKQHKETVFLEGVLAGYSLNAPAKVIALPVELKEVSGVAAVSPSTVAMVQDEAGIIFRFDLDLNKVVQRVPFGPPGDYEEMTRVGNIMYVLESSGKLYEVQHWTSEKPLVTKRKLHLPSKDNESLCYDPVTDRLLISPKSRWKSGKKKNKLRPVFAVSPATWKMDDEPLFVLNIEKLLDFAQNHNLAYPTKKKKKKKKKKVKPNLRFMPASMAVHPVTHEIYMISAVDDVVISFNRDGEVTGFQMLNRKQFPQPEGLTFFTDGTMVMASEAKKGVAQLYIFPWQSADFSKQ